MRHNLAQKEEDEAPFDGLEAKLYDGTVTIQRGDFGSNKHAYFWKERNTFIPGATSILGILAKPALIQWAANKTSEYVVQNLKEGASKEEIERVCLEAKEKHVRLKEEGGDVGTKIHALAEKLFKGQPIEVPTEPMVLNGFNALREWIAANDVQPIESEKIVFSKSAFVAGTMDLLAAVNGKLAQVDLKSSTGIYPDHKFQVGGYKFCWEEESGEVIEQNIILHLNKKNGKMKPYVIDDKRELQFHVDTFLRTKALSENLRKMGEY